ncbi:MAG: hypothetical protein IJ062_08355 [Firmicutes bacterium]|nr:hypothetical protein [Bacillota bacterium]
MDNFISKIKTPAVLAVIAAFFAGSALCFQYNIETVSVLPIIIMLFIVPLFKKDFEIQDKKTDKPAAVCGLLFTLACVSVQCEKFLSYGSLIKMIYAVICCSAGSYLFYKCISKLLLGRLRSVEMTVAGKTGTKQNVKLFLIFSLCIFLCRLPYFLYVFPGNIQYDSAMQLLMAVRRMEMSNHHPFVHTMLIRACMDAGMNMFGTQTAGAAIYSIVQCLLHTFAFAYVLQSFYAAGADKRAVYVSLAFYCLMPYHTDYAFYMVKDTLFGSITLVLVLTLWRMMRRPSLYEAVMFVVFGINFCLYRNNAFFAFIMCLPVIAAVFWKKNKRVVILALFVLASCAIIRGPIYTAIGVLKPSPVESYSVPLQHIARTVANNGKITDKQYEMLNKILDVSQLPAQYNAENADPIKWLVRDTGDIDYLEAHKGEYFKLWLDIGLKNPLQYFLAEVGLTSGYYYPDMICYYGTSDFWGDQFGLDIHKVSLAPIWLQKIITALNEMYKTVYIAASLWSIGLMCWIMIFCAALCVCKGKKELLVIYAPMAALIITLLIATPVNREMRYAYYLFTTAPLMCIIPFLNTEKQP